MQLQKLKYSTLDSYCVHELTWDIRANCDRIFCAPSEPVFLSILIYNNSKVSIDISKFIMSFDFGPVLLIAPNILIPPKCEQLAQYRFIVPRSVWGRKHFTLGYQINYFNGNSRKLYGNFADKHGMYFTYHLNIVPSNSSAAQTS
jgi:hypothetical protein